jgi:anti-anti-sigma factor
VTLETLLDDGVRLVRAHGELDVVASRSLLARLPELIEPVAPLVLDLSEVTFFDSSGVRLVDRLAREQARQHCGFRVVAPAGARARRVLDVVGMSEQLVCEDLATAVEQVLPPR